MFNHATFQSATINTHNPAVGISSSRERTLTGCIGALTTAALVTASLSVALPLQVQVVPQLNGHSSFAHDGTGQLTVNPDGITVLAVVTKGQKG